MDKRTKTLAIVFVAVLGAVVFARGIWPRWVKPLLVTEERQSELRAELEDLQAFNRRFQDAALEYKQLVYRAGSMDAGVVRDDLDRRLDALIKKHNFDEWRLSPKSAALNRKTNWQSLRFTVSGEAPLVSALRFLRDLYELPHVMRVIDPKLVPQGDSRSKKNVDKVKLTVAIEALVLPNQDVLPKELKSQEFNQPEEHVRHRDVDLQYVAARKPFLEYEPPRTPVVKRTPERKTEPKVVKPPPSPPPPDYRWKGRWRLVGTWRNPSRPEVHFAKVEDQGARSSERKRNVAAGEDFDGGELLCVQPRGALVRREDGDFVYRLGEYFASAMAVGQVEGFEDLKAQSQRLRMKEPPMELSEPDESKASGDAGLTPPKPTRRRHDVTVAGDGTTTSTIGDADGGTETAAHPQDMSALFGKELRDFVEKKAGESQTDGRARRKSPKSGASDRKSNRTTAGGLEGDQASKSGLSTKSAASDKSLSPAEAGVIGPKAEEKKPQKSAKTDEPGKPEKGGVAGAGASESESAKQPKEGETNSKEGGSSTTSHTSG